jgi:hypothetical protein
MPVPLGLRVAGSYHVGLFAVLGRCGPGAHSCCCNTFRSAWANGGLPMLSPGMEFEFEVHAKVLNSHMCSDSRRAPFYVNAGI